MTCCLRLLRVILIFDHQSALQPYPQGKTNKYEDPQPLFKDTVIFELLMLRFNTTSTIVTHIYFSVGGLFISFGLFEGTKSIRSQFVDNFDTSFNSLPIKI